MTLRFDQKIHTDGDEFLCISDTSIRKNAVCGVRIIDGNMNDKAVELELRVHSGDTYKHRFTDVDSMNLVLKSLGLFYTPNQQGL